MTRTKAAITSTKRVPVDPTAVRRAVSAPEPIPAPRKRRGHTEAASVRTQAADAIAVTKAEVRAEWLRRKWAVERAERTVARLRGGTSNPSRLAEAETELWARQISAEEAQVAWTAAKAAK